MRFRIYDLRAAPQHVVSFIMTEHDMLNEMCLAALGQGDLKAIGRSRGFEAELIHSRELFRHGFLSLHGVQAALATLEPRSSACTVEVGGSQPEFYAGLSRLGLAESLWHTGGFFRPFPTVKERLISAILLFGTV
jgi:hypothetical protein